MQAFIEWLYRPQSGLEGAVGLLRVGLHASKFGDPYDGAIAFRVENGVVVCKGLHNYGGVCPSCGLKLKLSRAHVVAGLRELSASTGLDVHWTHNGKESQMARIRDAQNIDKTWNWGQLALLVLNAIAEFLSGQQIMVDAEDGLVDVTNSSHIKALGCNCAEGDEFQISVRRKGQGKKLIG